MHVEERYAMNTGVWINGYVQTYLKHPVLQGISASIHVDVNE